MRWNGLNLLVCGYGVAAAIAVLLGIAGYGLVASVVLFWLGGAILTIAIGAVRLVRGPQARPTNGLGAANVIRLEPSVLRPTTADRPRT